MAREGFIANLRRASRMLPPPRVTSGKGPDTDAYLSSILDSADLWLTPGSVADFNAADFADWPKKDREELAREVASFRALAQQVPPDQPAIGTQSQQARKHLESIIDIVRRHLLPEWLDAQQRMHEEAAAAAKTRGWYVERDEKQLTESLLGAYTAPRLRIKTTANEVVLEPIARFGSGGQGVVDLLVMPTYERTHLLVFKDGSWEIVSPYGKLQPKPFTQATLINTITRLPH
ncbi:MAG TPA: hypothetical protein VL371_00970 [Gemmataceae bacterium]|jgi:hypothetical protein|nr:hypothetical protein [Gemmataceae bacterium]